MFPGIGYYKFHWNSSTIFLEALSKCRDEGGHLIIINSEEEAGVVRHLFSSHKPEKLLAYAGFFDPAMGQHFVTIFGQPLNETGYQKWGRHQPNGRENESCGYVYEDGTIGDVVCSSPLPFMCEYDLSWNVD
ncbi:hypothetical protein J437_LFUL004424 [Ladona fulva]|uniref:C-type lectin domain-containing protein n=1 Tax=Ladona fulva TaxID=123851 RepID=A0A8K0NSZ8_LADFU|nr:hypothetical protein J437_LFUL004424 [Ladona fulva]